MFANSRRGAGFEFFAEFATQFEVQPIPGKNVTPILDRDHKFEKIDFQVVDVLH